MAELKPCPFCGSTDIKFAAFDAEDEGSVLCMMCKKCEACGPVVDPTPDEGDLEYQQAISALNKMVSMKTPTKEEIEHIGKNMPTWRCEFGGECVPAPEVIEKIVTEWEKLKNSPK